MTGSERIAEYARTAREAVRDRAGAVALLRLAARSVEGFVSPAARSAFAAAIGHVVALSDDKLVDFETVRAVEFAKRVAIAEATLDPGGYAMQLVEIGAMSALHSLVMPALLQDAAPSVRAMFSVTAGETKVGGATGDTYEKGNGDA